MYISLQSLNTQIILFYRIGIIHILPRVTSEGKVNSVAMGEKRVFTPPSYLTFWRPWKPGRQVQNIKSLSDDSDKRIVLCV